MANHELSAAEWLDKAEAYCARSEHCAADVRRKLYEWGTPTDFYDEILEKLYAMDFLDDTRFCQAYVHDKLEYQHWGRIKIQAGLRALQLPENSICNALETIDRERYVEILRDVAIRSGKTDSALMRFLLQRGFSYEEITHNLRIRHSFG